MILKFGKHKGKDIKTVPIEYLLWGQTELNSPILRKNFEAEIARRKDWVKGLLEKGERETLSHYLFQSLPSPEDWEGDGRTDIVTTYMSALEEWKATGFEFNSLSWEGMRVVSLLGLM